METTNNLFEKHSIYASSDSTNIQHPCRAQQSYHTTITVPTMRTYITPQSWLSQALSHLPYSKSDPQSGSQLPRYHKLDTKLSNLQLPDQASMEKHDNVAIPIRTWTIHLPDNATRPYLYRRFATFGLYRNIVLVVLMMMGFLRIAVMLGLGAVLSTAQFADENGFLEVEQVQAPPIINVPSNACQVQLMQHVFGNSYGQPFVGQYTGPPAACPGPWKNVLLNLSVVSAGRQFDRLATAWLGDVLLWETSTAEPNAKGIHFEYWKETQAFSSVWMKPNQFIFDLGNIQNDVYTGSFNATLTATFVPGSRDEEQSPPDLILPISKGPGQFFTLPDDTALVTLQIPAQNLRKASIQIFASGNGNEEFWYSNTFNEYTDTFTNQTDGTTLLGGGPFREVQVLFDGQVAGVVWPFPIVYTGGIVPGLWRPIVGINAYDVPSYEISLDPYLGLLSDGKAHTFQLKVVGMPAILENWFAAANFKGWTSSSPGITTGTVFHHSADPVPRIYATGNVGKGNSTLSTTVTTARSITITSRIHLAGSKSSKQVSWKQEMSYSNVQTFKNGGNTQTVAQTISGSNSDRDGILQSYSYPITFDTTYQVLDDAGSFELTANVDRQYAFSSPRYDQYSPVGTIGQTMARQVGDAWYIANATAHKSNSTGSTQTDYTFQGPGSYTGVQSYGRHVYSSGDKIVSDAVTLNGQNVGGASRVQNSETVAVEFAFAPLKDLLGKDFA